MSDNAPAPVPLQAQIRTKHFWLMIVNQLLLGAVAWGFLTGAQANAINAALEAAIGAVLVLTPVVYQLAARWRAPARQWNNIERVERGLLPLPDRGPWPVQGFDLEGKPITMPPPLPPPPEAE